jgi:hypothetical protein
MLHLRSIASSFCFALVAAASARANVTMHRYLVLDRTDYVATGVGGIGAPGALGGGEGTLTLDGVSGTVTLALLYWNGIDVEMPEIGLTGGDRDYDEPDVVFDGSPITGTRVAGFGSNDCWPTQPQPASAALYRADVTAIVAARGNGDYDFSGLADKPGHSANGLSLIVYFDDGNPANDRRITQYEGMQSDTEEFKFEPDIDYAGGAVEAVLHVSDGQIILNDGSLRWVAPPPIPDLSDLQVRYYDLYDGLPLWPGESVPQLGHGRNSTGPGLWDIRHVPLTPLFGPPKTYPTRVVYNLDHDCVSLQVAQIVQPADPAPSMLSPNPFDFGDVPVGTTSAPQRFTLTNLMPDDIEVGAPTIGNSQFRIVADACGGATLAPAGTCTIDVTYTPAGVLAPHDYPLIASFHDTVFASVSAPVFALLRGAGVPDAPFSRVEFDRTECEYPDTSVQSSTGAVHFTATNTGTLPVTLTELEATLEDDYPLYGATCLAGAVLAPGQACAVDAAFRPTATGRRAAGLLFWFTADDAQQGFVRADLDGSGLPPGDTIHADGFEPVICSPW